VQNQYAIEGKHQTVQFYLQYREEVMKIEKVNRNVLPVERKQKFLRLNKQEKVLQLFGATFFLPIP
jgi:hypothetical protein